MEQVKVEPEVSEVAACRACLAMDGRLYDIRQCGLQEAFIKLVGTPFPLSGLHHLCPLCFSELSKFAAFRDRCQRVHELLETLLEWGPLKMEDIRTIDRDSHKLTRNLIKTDIENVDSKEKETLLSIPIKTEKDIDSVFVDTNFKKLTKQSEDSDELTSIEVEQIKAGDIKEVIKKQERKRTTLKKRKSLGSCEISTKPTKIDTGNTGDIKKQKKKRITLKKKKSLGSSEFSTKPTKIDTGNTGDIKKQQKPTALKKRKSAGNSDVSTEATIDTGNNETQKMKKKIKVGDDIYPDFDYKAFENQYKVKITLLNKNEQKAELEARKLTSNYLQSPFRCEICGKGFNYLNTLTNHMSYHDHSVGPFECEICLFRFATKRKHSKHRELHRLKFTCQECGFVSRSRGSAQQHCGVHEGRTHACPHCGRVFARASSCFNHARVAHPTRNVACDLCGETFLSALGVSLHKSRGHRENIKQQHYKCPTCDVNFNNLEALEKHKRTTPGPHAAGAPCAECGEPCAGAAALRDHAARCHPPDQHRCHECDATFLSAASFETHHRRKHLGQRRPQQRPRAHPHTATSASSASSARRVVCEICGKLIYSEAALKYHRWIHEADKPFKCSRCPKAFAAKHTRDWHLRTHTGEKPHRCELCPAAFTVQSNLKRHHKVVHLNQRKSVPCVLCDKTFASQSNMKLHISTAHDKMPWPKRKRRNKEAQ